MSLLAVLSFLALLSLAPPAAGESETPHGAVDVTILLDASTSMKPAWDRCRTHLPVLLESLQARDCLRVIVFGRAEDVRTVVNQRISSPADLASIVERLAGIACDLRGSVMSVGFDEALDLWGDSETPRVFIVVTDAIVWPPQGPAHDAEWSARWESARPIRQDPSVHRVIFGVRTKEPEAKSMERLKEVLLPQQVLMLGEDDLADFEAGLADLRRLVEQARVPAPAEALPAAEGLVIQARDTRRWLLLAGLCLAVALAASAVRAAITRRRVLAGAYEDDPLAGSLSVEAWTLDERFERVGSPETWRFDVPDCEGIRVLIGGPDHAWASCQVAGVEMMSPDPVVIHVDGGGCRFVVVPSFETVLLKDEVPGFNPDARCLDEALFRRLDAGGESRLCLVRGQPILMRVLPGRNELELSFHAVDASGGDRDRGYVDGVPDAEEALS